MSIDKSLRSKVTLQRPRSVLTRLERIDSLKEAGRWQEGDTVFGLAKVRTYRPKRRRKAAEKKTETAAATAEAAAATPPAASK